MAPYVFTEYHGLKTYATIKPIYGKYCDKHLPRTVPQCVACLTCYAVKRITLTRAWQY